MSIKKALVAHPYDETTNEFFIKEGEPENVFATGTFISEVGEAGMYFINESENVSKNYIGNGRVTKFN